MRLRLEVSPMQHNAVRVRWTIVDAQAITGIGNQHLHRFWWLRLKQALEVGCAAEEIPLEITETIPDGVR